ncbi:MAG: cytochrome C [Arcobacter sp.]|uniref:c-type cytochrome n=1 Tax=uncultured Arcobacter sp. TaxID=165434 RepID=UPI000CA752EE|nr:c-type cytochrome [uncultured Arcobacter sp.]PLY11259.1 MAG: cytochrome C [Arcobacter sp.]
MKKIILLTSILACAAFAAPYDKCVACHGANGEKAAMGKSKVLSDMSKADIVSSLKGYQDGTYGGPMKGLMKGQVTGLSDADINAIAEKVGK